MEEIEIERKYLLDGMPEDCEDYPSRHITQSYIYINPIMDVRIRDVEQEGKHKYYYTVKMDSFRTMSMRKELESEISEELYESLLFSVLPGTNPVCKTRYNYPIGPYKTAEIDVYEKSLHGLTTVEVEFCSLEEMDMFTPPDWFGEDVTENETYKNKSLCQMQYKNKSLRLFKEEK